MTMAWFKFPSSLRNDPKFKRLPIHQRYAYIVLMCLASESSDRGTISDLDDEDLAFELEMALEDWQTLKAKFRVKGLIALNASGNLSILNWKEQYEAPVQKIRFSTYRKHQESVFLRDGFKCVYCESTTKLTLDHVMPQSRGGSHDPENLVCCCSTCNSSKGTKTIQEWRRGKS